ncbi:hypothetical protein [uncultured Clostridium sp.]|uniref:hypothetical protein n=1 Tax=uncultured Clostridium sp. TaxID=59620 RepID=UPI0025E0B877|nr:hypothetical protein [uncultured Clostridium sp.]
MSVSESYFTSGVTLADNSYKINFTKNQHTVSKDYTGYYLYSISINDSENNVVQSFSVSKSVLKTTYKGDIDGELSWREAVSKADEVLREINYTDTTTADDILDKLKRDINRSNLEFTVDYKDKDTTIFVKINDTEAGYYTNIIY